MAGHGLNFMHLDPKITKFLVGMDREEGAEMAFVRLNETMEMVSAQFPGLSQEQAQQNSYTPSRQSAHWQQINRLGAHFSKEVLHVQFF